MIFGNAVLGDIPWEIIIKSYRTQLRDASFENLESYGNDFLKYIAKTDSFQNKKMQEQWVESNVTSYYKLIREDFLKETEPIIKNNGKITQEEVTVIIQGVIKRHHSNISTNKLIEGMDDAFEKQIRNKYTSLFRERKKAIFQEISSSSYFGSVGKCFTVK